MHIPRNNCSSSGGTSCSSLPSSDRLHSHLTRKTSIQRDEARQRFQQAFWTLCEDRRTCYRDDVIWNKLQPHRQALTDALQADILSPLFPAFSSSSSSFPSSSFRASIPQSAVEGVLPIPSLPPSSRGIASAGAGTASMGIAFIEEFWNGGMPSRNINLQEIIQIARLLPAPSTNEEEEEETMSHLENVHAEEEERALFVVDVLLSTLLHRPSELTILLKAVLSAPSSPSEESNEYPTYEETISPTIARAAPASTTASPSPPTTPLSLSPCLSIAILQSVLWLGGVPTAADCPPSASPTGALAMSGRLDREAIAKLAGVYMGRSLQAFQRHEKGEGKGHRDDNGINEGKKDEGRRAKQNARGVRRMDGVWSAFFITACIGQMKSKLLDLWWNHMCVCYDRDPPSFTWQAHRMDEGEEKTNKVGSPLRREWIEVEDSKKKEEKEEEEEKKKDRMGGATGSERMRKEEEGVEEAVPSWLDWMSTLSEERGPEAAGEMVASRSSPPSVSLRCPSKENPPREEEIRSGKGWQCLPYEAVMGVMATTADNSDIERTVHIYHAVQHRGLSVLSTSSLCSASWATLAERPEAVEEDQKEMRASLSSSLVFLPSEKSSSSSSTVAASFRAEHDAPLLQQHIQLRLLSKLLAATKFANNEDGGLRELTVADIKRYISPSVLLQSPWEVINDLLIGLNVGSAMHLVKTRAGMTHPVPSSSSFSSSPLPSSESTATTVTQEEKNNRLQREGEEASEHAVLLPHQTEFDDVPFFIWASLLRRCARDHMIDEAEALFSFLRACCTSISPEEKKELASIMIRMYATFSPPDSADALHYFLEYILKNKDTVTSTLENRIPPTSPSEGDTAKSMRGAPLSEPSSVSGQPRRENDITADDVLYSLLIRSADSRNASMMYFLESCADGVPLSVELFESLFGSHSYQTSLRSLQKRLPHDYSSSKLDSLIRIPTNIDAHLRREEAQLEHGQSIVDSTGESF